MIVATTTVNNKLKEFFASPEFMALVVGSSAGFIINEARQLKRRGEETALEAQRLKWAGEIAKATEDTIKEAIAKVEARNDLRINDLKEDIRQIAEIAREAREIASER